ncbi:hypothetical protein PM082_015014 [Marasmius tenuissimus]|nr:hypothetical protein PM082_015014 [Marasmius tenuissimus]
MSTPKTKSSREFADEAQLSSPDINTPRQGTEQRMGSPELENFEGVTHIHSLGAPMQVISSPAAVKQYSGTVTNLSSISRGSPGDRVFHHTDSGWRLRVDNVLGSRSLVEVPPTYSEAEHRREST